MSMFPVSPRPASLAVQSGTDKVVVFATFIPSQPGMGFPSLNDDVLEQVEGQAARLNPV